MTRFRRVLRLALVALVLSPIALLFAANAFLNIGLEPLLNQNPDKLRIRTSYAWMWWPGVLDVWGLECRGQGKNDQWLLEVDHAHALALRFKDTYGIRQVLPIQDMHGVYSFYFEDLDHNWWEIQYYENGFVHDDYFDFGDRFDMTPSEDTRA